MFARYGTNFSETFERLLADRTEANALFLTELLNTIEERGLIDTKHSDEPQLTVAIQNLQDLPEKIENVLDERLNRLESSVREILDFASVEGDRFIAQVLAKVKQLDEWEVIDELTQKLMKLHQLIEEEGCKILPNGACVDEFAFKHNLVRDYVYTQLPKSKRRYIHAKIGECLEFLYGADTEHIASELALHFYVAHIPEKAISYCLKASQQANRRCGASEAIQFGRMGIEILEGQIKSLSYEEYAEKKVNFSIEIAEAEAIGGSPGEDKDHIQEAIGYLESLFPLLDVVLDTLCAEVFSILGKLYERKGPKSTSKEYREKALKIYMKHKDRKNIAEMLYRLSYVYPVVPSLEKGKSPEERGIEALEKSLSIAEELQDPDLQSRCLNRLNYWYSQSNLAYAEECALKSLKLSKSASNPKRSTEIDALLIAAQVYERQAKFKVGMSYKKEALVLAQKVGNVLAESTALYSLATSFSNFADSQEEAAKLLEQSLAIRKRTSFRVGNTYSELAKILVKQGQWNRAYEYFQKAISVASELPISIYRHEIGKLYAIQGIYPQAKEEFLFRLNTLEKYQRNPNLSEYVDMALVYALEGNQSKCKEYATLSQSLFQQEVRPFHKHSCLYRYSEVYRLLNELDSAKVACQKALNWFLENVDTKIEDLIVIAEARHILGKILVDMGEYEKAIGNLEQSEIVFEQCKHYMLGESWLYIGKGYQGLGGVIFFNKAKEYFDKAVTEFQRIGLQDKKQKAIEMLQTSI